MIFDIIVLAVVLISALHAFWRGLIREVLTIFGAIGGVFAALAFGDDVRPFMDGWLGVGAAGAPTKLFDLVPMTLVSATLSYLAVFVLLFGVLSFISHLIAEQVRAIGLGAVDRTLGVVFGLARGLLIVGIFYLPLHIMMDPADKREWFKTSQSHMVVEKIAQWLETMIPGSMLVDEKPAPAPTTRDQLKEQGVLPGGDAAPAANPASAPASGQGYNTNDRKMIDQLIDRGIDAAREQMR
jgi:membrane protein required for colicin V production